MGLNWKILNTVFIAKGTSFSIDGPVGPARVVDRLAGINVILADLLLVWRCWILYGRNWKILTALILCLLAEIVAICGTMDIPALALLCYLELYYTVPAVTNILCTSLILFRLIGLNGVRASLKTYRGIIEILVESAFLYSAFFIGLVVSVNSQSDGEFGFIFPLMISYSFTCVYTHSCDIESNPGHRAYAYCRSCQTTPSRRFLDAHVAPSLGE
ncbi:hypothetical protein BDZ89DRAFT_1067498 [Hymenopellis radicata]|nr:hypothetical protein BDZ89DRAFT_1067498 [Hymenopellis radicata]